MYPNNPPDVPAIGGEYVPYFYQAGLHQLYALPSPNVPRQPRDSPRSSYDSSPAAALFQGADRTQTVEQVIANGYFAVPTGDPVTAIISDKMQTSWLGLDDLIGQVRERHEIYQQNFYQIELGKCAAINAIYAHEAYVGPPTSKQMYARHKAIQDLYEQQREERTTLWKDVSRLRMQIPESAQLYLGAHRKMSILAADPGDAP